MWRTLERSIVDAFGRLAEAFLAVIPAFLVLLASLVVGIVAGLLLRAILLGFLKLLGRRGRVSPPSAGSLLKAAGVRAAPEQVVGVASFWTAILVALAVGVNALEPGALRNALSQLVGYVPALLTATFLFVIGLGLAALARRSVLIAGVNAGLPWARPAARGVHAVIVASFAAAALDHLGVGRGILIAAFSIVAGGIVLALALAFGLGARELAKGYLERKLRAEEEDTGIRHV